MLLTKRGVDSEKGLFSPVDLPFGYLCKHLMLNDTIPSPSPQKEKMQGGPEFINT